MIRVALVLLLGAAACGGPRPVDVQVLIPNQDGVETPVPGVLVAALPYDRDSIIAAMESRAPTARPHTRVLDSLFQVFRGPFLTFSRVAGEVERLSVARDSVRAALARAPADGEPRTSLLVRQRALEDTLRALEPARGRARDDMIRARQTVWPEIERLRLDVHRWEVATYAGYDSIARALARNRLQNAMADTTDALGWARLHLPGVRWWIYVRSPDPRDPNAEWYWNLPLRRDTMILGSASGRNLPRY